LLRHYFLIIGYSRVVKKSKVGFIPNDYQSLMFTELRNLLTKGCFYSILLNPTDSGLRRNDGTSVLYGKSGAANVIRTQVGTFTLATPLLVSSQQAASFRSADRRRGICLLKQLRKELCCCDGIT
jgi:hypothetical protein